MQISPADCRLLTTHKPSPDVAYTPGVDVKGNPVVPADIGESRATALAEYLENNISFQMILQGDKGEISARGLKGEMILGVISLKDGQVMLDGVPLQAGASDRLVTFCREKGLTEK